MPLSVATPRCRATLWQVPTHQWNFSSIGLEFNWFYEFESTSIINCPKELTIVTWFVISPPLAMLPLSQLYWLNVCWISVKYNVFTAQINNERSNFLMLRAGSLMFTNNYSVLIFICITVRFLMISLLRTLLLLQYFPPSINEDDLN